MPRTARSKRWRPSAASISDTAGRPKLRHRVAPHGRTTTLPGMASGGRLTQSSRRAMQRSMCAKKEHVMEASVTGKLETSPALPGPPKPDAAVADQAAKQHSYLTVGGETPHRPADRRLPHRRGRPPSGPGGRGLHASRNTAHLCPTRLAGGSAGCRIARAGHREGRPGGYLGDQQRGVDPPSARDRSRRRSKPATRSTSSSPPGPPASPNLWS